MKNDMGKTFQNSGKLDLERQMAQVKSQLDHLAGKGFDKLEGNILQLAQTRSKPGRRPELLKILSKFYQFVVDEPGTLTFAHFPDAEDPDLVHAVQIYESWSALCSHLLRPDYFQFIGEIMEESAAEGLEYFYGNSKFLHRGTGTKA